jgi:hypothetical protein
MSLPTLMNLNRMVMLFAVIQPDEGLQSRLPNQRKSTALISFQELSEGDMITMSNNLLKVSFILCVCDHVKKFPQYQIY